MEAYVTKREFDHALKELFRVQTFLTETFGSKFADFRGKDSNADLNSQFTIDARKDLSNDNNVETVNKELVNVIDPFEDNIDDDCVPIVTSTKSLQVPTNQVPRVHSFHTQRASITVPPILHSKKVPISFIAPVIAPQKVTAAMQSNECQNTNKRIDRLESLADSASWLKTKSVCADAKHGLQHTPPQIPLLKSIKKTKVLTTPGEFQLRGRTFYHKKPSTVTINADDDKVSSNDSVPVAIGIETMEGIPSPPKRQRPPPLPSFKNRRTLGLQSTQKKPPTQIPTYSNTSSTVNTGRENEIIQCNLCNLFIYSSQLDSHMKNHSLLDGKSAEKNNRFLLAKIQICPICSIEFADYQMYEDHCAENHPEEGFPCPVCARRMSSKAKLKRHIAIHRKLKFECKICGKAYNRKDNLNAHCKTHGSNQAVSLFYCPMCNMAFSSRTGRDTHVACGHANEVQASHDCSDSPEHDSSSENEATNDQSTLEELVVPNRIKIESPIGFDFEYEGDDEESK